MRNAIFIGAALLVPFALWAADTVKPLDVKLGLWQSTITNQTSGTPPIPEEVLSRLSPDQRARMEAAIKAQMAKGAQPQTTKSCLTKEDLNQGLTFGGVDNNCKRTVISSSATKQDLQFECSQPNSIKASGTAHLEAINSENVKGTGSAKMSSGDGSRAMTMQINFSAKWLGSDCGDVGKK